MHVTWLNMCILTAVDGTLTMGATSYLGLPSIMPSSRVDRMLSSAAIGYIDHAHILWWSLESSAPRLNRLIVYFDDHLLLLHSAVNCFDGLNVLWWMDCCHLLLLLLSLDSAINCSCTLMDMYFDGPLSLSAARLSHQLIMYDCCLLLLLDLAVNWSCTIVVYST